MLVFSHIFLSTTSLVNKDVYILVWSIDDTAMHDILWHCLSCSPRSVHSSQNLLWQDDDIYSPNWA